MKVAIVHDFLNQYGGAERVVEALHEVFPDAPVYTTIFLRHRLPPVFASMDVRTSFMQGLPGLERHFKKYLLLYPRAIESFDLSGYDVVLSSSSAFAKGARRAPRNACHICYCYTPMRFAWNADDYLKNEDIHPLLRALLPWALKWLRSWDLRTVDHVDYYVAISENIRQRIRTLWRREADVIYPPVETARFGVAGRVGEDFLVVSRLNGYKKLELAVEAFNRLGLPLDVVGTGPYEGALRRLAGPTVRFSGRVSDDDLRERLASCRALVFPGAEDFGIAPLEAMACGRPVIAYAAGGALETVTEGKTGLFFREPTAASLEEAVRRFGQMRFDPAAIRRDSLRFDKEVFKRKIREYVEDRFRLGRNAFGGQPTKRSVKPA